MGTVLAIARREKKRAPMERISETQVGVDTGLVGDSRGRTEGRNVTVLSREGWEAACAALGEDLEWTVRRANFLVEGVDLEKSTGKRLRVGACLLQVTGECNPCSRMDEARAGLIKALEPDWRAGVMCIVLEGGVVALADAVRFE
jgi:MOSC domain-containing protein YiiM